MFDVFLADFTNCMNLLDANASILILFAMIAISIAISLFSSKTR